MATHELAGKPAPRALLVDVPRLVSAYYTLRPDPENPAHRVAFGTSGHRGSSFKISFNEGHVLAICQAICEHRSAAGIDGPMYVGKDTHALSEPALASAVEVFAANGVNLTNIDTRPSKRRNWEYYFFVDAEGHYENENFKQSLEDAREHCGEIHVLGSFPKALEPV